GGFRRTRTPMTQCSARFVYRPEYVRYDFGPQHPLRPQRIRSSMDLIDALGLSPAPEQQLQPPAASLEELQLVHRAKYVEAVERLDLFSDDPVFANEAERWGLGRGDSPAFAGMHAAAAMIAGGTLYAIQGVLAGSFD